MARFQVTPPEQFDFEKPADLEKWFVRFDRFKPASGLSEKSQEQQVNALVYCMGKEADDVLKSFGLSDKQQKFIQQSQENMSTISMLEEIQYLNVQDLI